jgi:hypothetical protein
MLESNILPSTGAVAIITFEKRIFIDRSPQDVFDYMSDPAKDAEWRAGSRSAEWDSEGPIGVGSIMRSEDRSMGRKVETLSQITTWDPPHGYGFKSMSSSFPAEFHFKLEPQEEGTQLTAWGSIEFKGIAKLMEWIFGGQIKKQAEEDFMVLKQMLEPE